MEGGAYELRAVHRGSEGTIQIHHSGLYYTINVAGCVAIITTKGGNDSCAFASDTAASCRRESCEQCFEAAGASFSDFTKCQSEAAASQCKTYQKASEDKCLTAKTDAPTCFAAPAEAPRDFAIRIEETFCMKP